MYRRNLDILVAGVTALLGGAAFVVHAPEAVRVVLGVALFFAPGYLWSEAILSQRLPGIERVLTSAGLALIFPILGGFLFYGLKIPLLRPAWVGLLVVLTLLGVVAVAIQRLREPPADPRADPRLDPRQDPRFDPRDPRFDPRQEARGRQQPAKVRVSPLHAFIFAVAAVIALGSVAFSVKSADAQKQPPYTEFGLTTLTTNALKAYLDVQNEQGVTEQYRVKFLAKGKVQATWNFTLVNGQSWQTTVAYSMSYSIVADLYLLPNVTTPYRYVDNGEQPTAQPTTK